MKKVSFIFIPFLVLSICLISSCKQKFDDEIYNSHFNPDPENISALAITPEVSANSISVLLTWELPSQEISNINIVCENELSKTVEFEETLSNKATQWKAYNLSKDLSYKFTVRTVKANGTKSKGLSVSYSYISTELVGYKSNLLAYDFGYVEENSTELVDGKVTKSFEFKYGYTNSNSLNLNTLALKSVCGNKNAFTLVSCDKEILTPGSKTTITVSYKPDYSDKTWDEAEFYFTEDTDTQLNLCLIGSTFRQPKNIASENLRLWLRPDFISSTNINSDNRCIVLPDFSGNHFDAKTYTHQQNASATNPGPIYQASSTEFNKLPVLYYTNGGLKSSGDICSYKSYMRNSEKIINENLGTTAFVIYKTDSKNQSTWFLSCYSGYSTSFPLMGTISRNWDYTAGFNSISRFHPALLGNGMSTGRFFYDPDNYAEGKINTPLRSDDNENKNKAHTMIARSTFRNFSKNTVYGTGTNNYFTNNPNYDISKSFDISTGTRHLFYYYNSETNSDSNKYTYFGVPYENSIEGWHDGKYYNLAYTYSLSKISDTLLGVSCFSSGEPWGAKENYNKKYSYIQNENARKVVDKAYLDSSYNNPSHPSYASYFNNNINTTPETFSISDVFIGKNYNNSNDSSFYIADVIIYNKTLSEKEIAEVNNYIYYRWGVGQLISEE